MSLLTPSDLQQFISGIQQQPNITLLLIQLLLSYLQVHPLLQGKDTKMIYKGIIRISQLPHRLSFLQPTLFLSVYDHSGQFLPFGHIVFHETNC